MEFYDVLGRLYGRGSFNVDVEKGINKQHFKVIFFKTLFLLRYLRAIVSYQIHV